MNPSSRAAVATVTHAGTPRGRPSSRVVHITALIPAGRGSGEWRMRTRHQCRASCGEKSVHMSWRSGSIVRPFSGDGPPGSSLALPCGAGPFFPWGTRSMTGCRVAGQVPLATARERDTDAIPPHCHGQVTHRQPSSEVRKSGLGSKTTSKVRDRSWREQWLTTYGTCSSRPA